MSIFLLFFNFFFKALSIFYGASGISVGKPSFVTVMQQISTDGHV